MIDPRIRKTALFGIPAYVVACGCVAWIVQRQGISAAAGLLLSAAGPLMMAGTYLARLVAIRSQGPIRRFWSHVSKGNLALGGAFISWSSFVLTDYRPFALLAVSLAVASAFWYSSAVASRIKAMEGTDIAALNLANLVSIVATLGCFYLLWPFAPLVHKRGLSPALFLGLVLTSAGGLAYLLAVLFKWHRGHARPPDRILGLGVGSALIFAAADVAYLLADRPLESVTMAFAALVVLMPLALSPVAETGHLLHPDARPAGIKTRWAPIAFSGLALVVPAAYLIVSSEFRTPWRLGALVAAYTAVLASAITNLRVLAQRADLVAARQEAVETLYEREAAKEAALLDILQRVAEGWGMTDIVEGALRAVVETTSASRAVFLVVDMARNSVRLLGARGFSDEEIAELQSKLTDPYSLQRSLRAGRTFVTTQSPIQGLSDTSARFGAFSFASTAISGWEEGGTAVICADSLEPDTRFTEDDIRMMEAIADYVGLAISRVRLFRELAASEERYRVLVEESTDGVVELDPGGRILFCNRAFASMLGQEPVQLLGESFPDLLGVPRWASPAIGEISRTTAAVKVGGEESILEIYQSQRRDGKVQAVVRNVTERHNQAQRLRQLYEQLAEKERLRTLALSKLIKAEEETRARVAADLHDGPVQEFSRLAIALDLAKRHLEMGNLQVGIENLSEVRKCLSAEVLRLRFLMTELRPPVLEERGLREAIETYCRSFENQTGITVHIRSSERLDIDKSTEIVLYRIFQEAMTNVKKHSFARHVEISLEESPEGRVELTISDDGVGFDPNILESVVQGGHIGIVSMTERAQLAGGSCQVHGSPGQGTTVRVTISGEVNEHAG